MTEIVLETEQCRYKIRLHVLCRMILDLQGQLIALISPKGKMGNYRRELSKRLENTAGKGEIARYEQFLLFPRCFQKTCAVNT